MSLPMLVNGADCGPSNALQSLTKQVDRDRGVSQDLFGRNKSGSSSSQVKAISLHEMTIYSNVSVGIPYCASVCYQQIRSRER